MLYFYRLFLKCIILTTSNNTLLKVIIVSEFSFTSLLVNKKTKLFKKCVHISMLYLKIVIQILILTYAFVLFYKQI